MSDRKQLVLKWMTKIKAMEREIANFQSVLEANGVGLEDPPLVDNDGFPRNDINVMDVRNARRRILYLRNDHRGMMGHIENGLHEIHAEERENKNVVSNEVPKPAIPVTPGAELNAAEPLSKPIAAVNKVEPNSPAALAGIQFGDLIIQFGVLNANTFLGLLDFRLVAQNSKGKEITVRVKRRDQTLDLKLTPKDWAGNGILGCNVIAVDHS